MPSTAALTLPVQNLQSPKISGMQTACSVQGEEEKKGFRKAPAQSPEQKVSRGSGVTQADLAAWESQQSS